MWLPLTACCPATLVLSSLLSTVFRHCGTKTPGKSAWSPNPARATDVSLTLTLAALINGCPHDSPRGKKKRRSPDLTKRGVVRCGRTGTGLHLPPFSRYNPKYAYLPGSQLSSCDLVCKHNLHGGSYNPGARPSNNRRGSQFRVSHAAISEATRRE